MVIEIFLLPHYLAPFTAALYAIGLQMMRHLRVWKPEGKPSGLAMVRLMVIVCVAMAGLRIFAAPLHLRLRNGRQATGILSGLGRSILVRSERRWKPSSISSPVSNW